jgi:hypothetical protein
VITFGTQLSGSSLAAATLWDYESLQGRRQIMDKKLSDAEKIIQSSKLPKGVVTKSSDGRLFFLTNEEAASRQIKHPKLYLAYLATQGQGPIRPDFGGVTCEVVKKWLDESNPDDQAWRSVCFIYFLECVDE